MRDPHIILNGVALAARSQGGLTPLCGTSSRRQRRHPPSGCARKEKSDGCRLWTITCFGISASPGRRFRASSAKAANRLGVRARVRMATQRARITPRPLSILGQAASACASSCFGRNSRRSVPAVMRTTSPSRTSPSRIFSASGSCTCFWITRLSGRAP